MAGKSEDERIAERLKDGDSVRRLAAVVVVVCTAKSSIFDGFERFARFGVDDA